ncbi:restriction endonuclease subunit S [Pseudoalteromonas marina]|jgi:type I restriction enzyme S subunit|uniref:restriction endonuclease subunit S n=1 Tax=Pseudoalteromonas marina TaxID=267375 RepID=UPI0030720C2B
MVPSGWSFKKLEEANITITDGDRGKEYPKSTEFSDSGYCLFLSAKNVSKNGFSFSETQFISETKHKKLRKGIVNKGDIVLTTRGTVGQFAYYNAAFDYAAMRINSGMVTLNCSEAELSSDFFYVLSKSSIIKKQIDSAAFGSAQPQLTVKIIKSLKLPIPPLPEQQKIASILGTWDKAISTTEHLIDNSKQQKKALMQQLLTGKKRLLDDSGKPFEGEWIFSIFTELFKVANDKKTQVKSGDYLEIGDIPVVDQGKRLISGYTNNVEKHTNLPVIIFGDHTRIIKWVDFEFAQGADGTQVLKENKCLDAKFSYYLLQNTDIPNLGYSRHMRELKEKDLKYPKDKQEQQKIASVLTNADNEIELLEQQLADLKQEKKALMQQLLTGKRRVKVESQECIA